MEMVNKGKKIVVLLIIIDLLINGASLIRVSINGNMNIASSKFLQSLIRLIFSGFIFFFLYKGYSWARWILMILNLLAGVYSLVSILINFNMTWLLISLFYLYFGLTLMLSGEVNAFFEYQSGKLTSNNYKNIH